MLKKAARETQHVVKVMEEHMAWPRGLVASWPARSSPPTPAGILLGVVQSLITRCRGREVRVAEERKRKDWKSGFGRVRKTHNLSHDHLSVPLSLRCFTLLCPLL